MANVPTQDHIPCSFLGYLPSSLVPSHFTLSLVSCPFQHTEGLWPWNLCLQEDVGHLDSEQGQGKNTLREEKEWGR